MQFEFEFLFLYILYILLYFIICTPAKDNSLRKNWMDQSATSKVNKSNTFQNSLIKLNLKNKYYFIKFIFYNIILSNSFFYSLPV